MKILIPGGAGFMGMPTAKLLASEGHDVLVVDPRAADNEDQSPEHGLGSLTFLGISLEDPAVVPLLNSGIDLVINFAGALGHSESVQDPMADLHANVITQVCFLQQLAESTSRPDLIYCSTRQIYGAGGDRPWRESDACSPPDPNGVNKWAAEQYHRLYANRLGLRYTALRLPNVYGPGLLQGTSGGGVLGNWFSQAWHGEPITIYGSGEALRDFLYVDDWLALVQIIASTQSRPDGVFNVAGDVASLATVASIISSLANVPFTYEPMPDTQSSIDVGSSTVDDASLRKCTGWSASTSVNAGLASTWEALIQASSARAATDE